LGGAETGIEQSLKTGMNTGLHHLLVFKYQQK